MRAKHSPNPIDIEVGARIRVQRKHLKISQTELASTLGLTFQQVQKYERGSNRISASMLVKTAEKLETTVAALIGENDKDRHSHEIYQKLSTPGALELVECYTSLPDAEVRRAIVSMIRSLTRN